MKVVLLADVKSQGKKGDVITVSDGYANNFLFPRKLAVMADKQVLAEMKGKEDSKRYSAELEKKAAQDIAEKLKAVTVSIKAQGGADGRTYGSVTAKDIAEALSEQYGIDIDKRKIVLDDAIKAYGSYTVTVKLHTAVSGKINFVVTK